MITTINHPADQIVELKAFVPAARAVEAQALLAEYLRSAPALGGTGWSPPFDASHGPKDPWKLPGWEDSDYDHQAMAWIVSDLRPAQLDILLAIYANPGTTASRDLVENAGYEVGKQPNGIFRAIGGRFRRCNRRPVWNGGPKTDRGQLQGWTSNPAATRLFTDAVRAAFPDKALGLSG